MEASLLGVACIFLITTSLGVGLIIGFLLGLAYSRSYRDGSEATGERKWDYFQRVLQRGMNVVMKTFFSFQIEYHGEDLEREVRGVVNNVTGEGERVVFAASPHGLFPISCFFHVLTPYLNSRTHWNTLIPFTHYLSFSLPLLREFVLWLGLRDATRENITRTLREEGSIYVSLGGAREMMSEKIETRHRGLLRIAFQEKKRVFPVLHQGQNRVFHCYSTQWLDTVRNISLDLVGYPLPTFFTIWPSPLTTHIFPAHNPHDYEEEDEFIDEYYRKVKECESSLCQ